MDSPQDWQESSLDVVEGRLKVTVVSELEGGFSRTDYFLEARDEEWIELVSEHPIALEPDTRIRVKGRYLDTTSFQALEVEEIGRDPEIGLVQQELIAASPRRTAVILFNFRNDTSQPITIAQARSQTFTAANSNNAYFQEVSFGVRSLVGKNRTDGDVFGWYTISASNSPCNYSDWSRAARDQARAAGVDLSGYHHIIHMFPRTSACSWGGVGQLGGQYTWINGTSRTTTAHELGHNFNLHHSSSLRCTDSSGRAVPISNNCTSSEYGDPFDIMGRAANYYHLNAYHKGKLGWFEPQNMVTVTSSGTFELAPIETKSQNGIQSLRVRIGSTANYYYVEYRQPYGFDNFAASSSVANGVLIRRAPDYATRAMPQLLDMTPSTSSFNDAALPVGQTFTDADARISIRLDRRSSSSAVVTVSLGGSSGGGTGGGGGSDGGSGTGCRADEVAWGGHCYALTASLPYDQAKAACESRGRGWRLAVIGSASENAFVSGLIGNAEFWLDGTDRATEGEWIWGSINSKFWTGGLNGGPVGSSYTNWTPGEPNNGGGNSHCLRMIGDGTWRDIQCNASYRGVCESQ